jgi:hypothetical protein
VTTDLSEEDLREAAVAMVAGGAAAVTAEKLHSSGWVDLLEEDDRAAVATLFEESGRSAVATGALVHVAAGASASLADEPFSLCFLAPGHPRPDSDVWNLSGVVPGGAVGHRLVVCSPKVEDAYVAVVQVSTPSAAPVGGIDPDAGWHRLDQAEVRTIRVLDQPEAASVVVALSRAIHHERLGAAQAMLDIAVQHATDRHQFNRPIGSYQAVQHRLVDVHVAVRAAHAALRLAWARPEVEEILSAGVQTDAAVETAIQHTLQVCGGMGFTDEFPLGARIRHALMLGSLLPEPWVLARTLGERLARSGELGRLGGFDNEEASR